MTNAICSPLLERAENPVLRFGKQLGRDEIYAAAVGAVATAVAYWLIDLFAGGDASVGLMAAVLPWVGPVLEKPGLVMHYVLEGVVAHRRGEGSLLGCVRRNLFDGRAWRTLRADVLGHDPAYGAMMFLGIWLLTPDSAFAVGFLSVLCFVAAVFVAAAMDVALVELGHRRLTTRLARMGFVAESYCETRYLIVADDPRHAPERVLERIAERFGLTDLTIHHYVDLYHATHRLPECNGRNPHLRVRTVYDGGGAVLRRTLQVVYTRPGEIGRDAPSLFRCFAVRKDKHALCIAAEGPVPNDVLKLLGAEPPTRTVRFSRLVARDPDGLLVTADVLADGTGTRTYWIEAKVRDDLDLLRAANEFIAMHFPVRGTTRSKFNLVEELEEFCQAEVA